MIRILVSGGRDLKDRELVFAVLDDLVSQYPDGEEFFLIEGGAPGADRLAHRWRKERDIDGCTKDADWDRYGHAAGNVRNQVMVDMRPDVFIAFPGRRGTADCSRRALLARIPKMVFASRNRDNQIEIVET